MEIEEIDIDQVIPYEKNPRKKDKAIDIVATSIKEYGIKQPIVVDSNNIIVVGHTRYEACKKLGIDKIPVLRAKDLSDAQIKGYRIMDNKSNEFAEWDTDLLNQEILELKDSNFDLELTGFEDSETDFMTGDDAEEDDYEPPAEEDIKTNIQQGDLFQIGNHRLMCGDATSEEDLNLLMNEEKAEMLITDPPYNVDYGWNTFEGNPNRFKNRKIQNDKLSDDDWRVFVEKYMKNILNYVIEIVT